MHDLVEWAAAQPWCDGNVGMIGISYFAMTQLEAAVERPPHLQGDLPGRGHRRPVRGRVAPRPVQLDVRRAVPRDGRRDGGPQRRVLARQAARRRPARAARARASTRGSPPSTARRSSAMKRRCGSTTTRSRGTTSGERWRSSTRSATSAGTSATSCRCSPTSTSRSTSAATGRTCRCTCPARSPRWDALRHNPNVRMGMLGDFGLTWPWESLHVEALAWFDHWLKGRDTGIIDGPPIRYWLPGADEWRTAETLAAHRGDPPRARACAPTARSTPSEGAPAARTYLCARCRPEPAGKASPTDPPSSLRWETAPLDGRPGHRRRRSSCGSRQQHRPRHGWIVTLQDVAPDGTSTDVTAGWLRASLREVDESASRPGAPVLPCRRRRGRARRRATSTTGSRSCPTPAASRPGTALRLVVSSDDQPPRRPGDHGLPARPVGTNALNTVFAESALLLPVRPAERRRAVPARSGSGLVALARHCASSDITGGPSTSGTRHRPGHHPPSGRSGVRMDSRTVRATKALYSSGDLPSCWTNRT